VTERVLQAAFDLFGRAGFVGVTMADVAREAAVGLDTIYRRWPSKQALLVDVVASAVTEAVRVPDTGSLEADLLQMVGSLAETAEGPVGRVIAIAIAASSVDRRLLAQLADAQQARRNATAVVLTRAIERGELPESTDINLVLDFLSGLVWHRVFVTGVGLRPAAIKAAVTLLLAGVARA
jgi:AcrR family transcriptional regulator